MHNMNVNDSNIQQRLQVLNYYLQRTIDVLAETRAAVLGIGGVNPAVGAGMGVGAGAGLSHTGVVNPFIHPQMNAYMQQMINPWMNTNAFGNTGLPWGMNPLGGTPWGQNIGLSHTPWTQQQMPWTQPIA